MHRILLMLPDDLNDRLRGLASAQDRTLAEVGAEVVRRGLAGFAEPVPPSIFGATLSATPPG